MKKGLFIGGILALVGSTVYYFKRQFDLAIDSDFNIKGIKVLGINNEQVRLRFDIEILNKSSFALRITDYNFKFVYKGVELANAVSDEVISVKSDSTFLVSATSVVDLQGVKSIALDFAKDVLKGKEIEIQIDGYVNINAFGITKSVNFDNNDILYKGNVLAEIGLDDDLEKIKSKVNNVLGVIGIKL